MGNRDYVRIEEKKRYLERGETLWPRELNRAKKIERINSGLIGLRITRIWGDQGESREG